MSPTRQTVPLTRLLRISEVARFVGLSERSVWAAISAGRIAVVRFGRRATRIEEDELARFIARAKAADAQ